MLPSDIIADELVRLGHRVLTVLVVPDCDDPHYYHICVICLGEQARGSTWHKQDLDEDLLRAWVDTRWD